MNSPLYKFDALGFRHEVKSFDQMLQELCPGSTFERDVSVALSEMALDFVKTVVGNACKIAKNRKSDTLSQDDIVLYLKQHCNMNPVSVTDEDTYYLTKHPVKNQKNIPAKRNQSGFTEKTSGKLQKKLTIHKRLAYIKELVTSYSGEPILEVNSKSKRTKKNSKEKQNKMLQKKSVVSEENKDVKETCISERDISVKSEDLQQLKEPSVKSGDLQQLKKHSVKSENLQQLKKHSVKSEDLQQLKEPSVKSGNLQQFKEHSVKSENLQQLKKHSTRKLPTRKCKSSPKNASIPRAKHFQSVSGNTRENPEVNCSLISKDVDSPQKSQSTSTLDHKIHSMDSSSHLPCTDVSSEKIERLIQAEKFKQSQLNSGMFQQKCFGFLDIESTSVKPVDNTCENLNHDKETVCSVVENLNSKSSNLNPKLVELEISKSNIEVKRGRNKKRRISSKNCS